MSALTVSSDAPRAPRLGAREAFDAMGVRLLVVLVAVVCAYHYSLGTLVSALGLDTPLAYLGLVPVIALGLVALRARPRAGEPDIHDRQLDLIVGIPLVAAALAMMLLLPAQLSTLYWVYRIDVLSMPLFVAGTVTLVFGVRVAWRLRFPIAFLLLAWPAPYNALVDHGLEASTGLTLSALKGVVAHWAVATPLPGSDGSLFSLGQGADAFTVSVASACAGVNSVVGFLLVGVAFLGVVKGSRPRKALWLLTGLVLIWLLNVARLLLIFWVGGQFGEGVAIDGLHPVIGLILFGVGTAVMLGLTGRFGLVLDLPPRPTDRPALRARLRERVPGARGLKVAGAVVLAATVVLTISNSGLSRYGLFADDLGAARLQSFQDNPAQVPGYSGAQVANYPWAQRFFGGDSSWDRFYYQGDGTGAGGAGAAPVVVDVVATGSLRKLSAYGIESCYRFHGYDVKGSERFELAGGIRGELITYKSAEQSTDWNALFWVWPVEEAGGGSHYERVVLLQSTDPRVEAATPSQELTSSRSAAAAGTGTRPGKPADSAQAQELRAFADSLIRNRGAVKTVEASGP